MPQFFSKINSDFWSEIYQGVIIVYQHNCHVLRDLVLYLYDLKNGKNIHEGV